jgi:hypothetical protein
VKAEGRRALLAQPAGRQGYIQPQPCSSAATSEAAQVEWRSWEWVRPASNLLIHKSRPSIMESPSTIPDERCACSHEVRLISRFHFEAQTGSWRAAIRIFCLSFSTKPVTFQIERQDWTAWQRRNPLHNPTLQLSGRTAYMPSAASLGCTLLMYRRGGGSSLALMGWSQACNLPHPDRADTFPV